MDQWGRVSGCYLPGSDVNWDDILASDDDLPLKATTPGLYNYLFNSSEPDGENSILQGVNGDHQIPSSGPIDVDLGNCPLGSGTSSSANL